MSSPIEARQLEAERQRALLAAILAPRADAAALDLQEAGERAARGLSAYRANAEALAERALDGACGSLRAMLGDEDFAHLAAEFWRARPPRSGDVGEWGDDIGDWLESHPAMAAWPYLADCARLDLALHRNERAADAQVDTESFALLASIDAAGLRLALMPGIALVSSRWPIVTIRRAHRSGLDADFAAAREAIALERGEHALVCRDGWRAEAVELDASAAGWMRGLLDGISLAAALESVAMTGFDFSAWLAQAIQQRWLKGVVRLTD
ncbi:MAG TPA: DNA-binding domain-containing protein [Burkholderiaceae bacterium]|nr:DNA-binding domain-containing protein [Burkholderiaceae bacterium]